MKKATALILLLVGLAGCGGGMPRDEQIEAIADCQKNNLYPDVRRSEMGYIIGIDCWTEKRVTAGKPCEDMGGVPILSSWDGTLKDCKFPPKAGK